MGGIDGARQAPAGSGGRRDGRRRYRRCDAGTRRAARRAQAVPASPATAARPAPAVRPVRGVAAARRRPRAVGESELRDVRQHARGSGERRSDVHGAQRRQRRGGDRHGAGGGVRGDQRGRLPDHRECLRNDAAAGASCDITVAFAPKTRSGSRTASLTVGAPLAAAATVSLSGTALPSLGLLAGGLGGPGPVDGTGAAARFNCPGGIASDGAGNLYVTDRTTTPSARSSSPPAPSPRSRARPASSAPQTGRAPARASPAPPASPSDGAGNLLRHR